MSFTEDELESFNTILEQRLLAQRQEFERMLDHRLEAFQRSFQVRMASFQQEFMRDASQKLGELHTSLNGELAQGLDTLHNRASQTVEDLLVKCMHTQEQQVENLVSRTHVLNLQGVEQLLQEYSSTRVSLSTGLDEQGGRPTSRFDAIEVQTELPLDALIEAFNRSLNERFASLQNVTQGVFKQWEEFLHTRLQTLSAQLFENVAQMQHHTTSSLRLESYPDLQSVLQGIDQLERVMESMQVAMTANQALLSNRIHHHQQLPFEKAHNPSSTQPFSQELHAPFSQDTHAPLSQELHAPLSQEIPTNEVIPSPDPEKEESHT